MNHATFDCFDFGDIGNGTVGHRCADRKRRHLRDRRWITWCIRYTPLRVVLSRLAAFVRNRTVAKIDSIGFVVRR